MPDSTEHKEEEPLQGTCTGRCTGQTLAAFTHCAIPGSNVWTLYNKDCQSRRLANPPACLQEERTDLAQFISANSRASPQILHVQAHCTSVSSAVAFAQSAVGCRGFTGALPGTSHSRRSTRGPSSRQPGAGPLNHAAASPAPGQRRGSLAEDAPRAAQEVQVVQ